MPVEERPQICDFYQWQIKILSRLSIEITAVCGILIKIHLKFYGNSQIVLSPDVLFAERLSPHMAVSSSLGRNTSGISFAQMDSHHLKPGFSKSLSNQTGEKQPFLPKQGNLAGCDQAGSEPFLFRWLLRNNR
jgi:hypothetical protein